MQASDRMRPEMRPKTRTPHRLLHARRFNTPIVGSRALHSPLVCALPVPQDPLHQNQRDGLVRHEPPVHGMKLFANQHALNRVVPTSLLRHPAARHCTIQPSETAHSRQQSIARDRPPPTLIRGQREQYGGETKPNTQTPHKQYAAARCFNMQPQNARQDDTRHANAAIQSHTHAHERQTQQPCADSDARAVPRITGQLSPFQSHPSTLPCRAPPHSGT
jgi:hypothetical protein